MMIPASTAAASASCFLNRSVPKQRSVVAQAFFNTLSVKRLTQEIYSRRILRIADPRLRKCGNASFAPRCDRCRRSGRRHCAASSSS
jgi:hypothetical protein